MGFTRELECIVLMFTVLGIAMSGHLALIYVHITRYTTKPCKSRTLWMFFQEAKRIMQKINGSREPTIKCRLNPQYGGNYTHCIWSSFILRFPVQLKNKALNIACSYPDWKFDAIRRSQGLCGSQDFCAADVLDTYLLSLHNSFWCAVKLEGCVLHFGKMNISLIFYNVLNNEQPLMLWLLYWDGTSILDFMNRCFKNLWDKKFKQITSWRWASMECLTAPSLKARMFNTIIVLYCAVCGCMLGAPFVNREWRTLFVPL